MTLAVNDGTNICFCISGSLSPADAATDMRQGTPTNVTLTLSGLVNGAGRQSAKADLGADRASVYALLGCVDFTGETPIVDRTVDYLWLPSTSAITANGNMAGNSGNDAAAPDGTVPSGLTLSEFIDMGAISIGSLLISDDASVQNGFIGFLSPPTRYGQLLISNNSGGNFNTDAGVEMHQVLIPKDMSDV